MTARAFVTALADTILPGGDGWPRGGETQAPDIIAERAGPVVDSLRGLLPADFADSAPSARTNALRVAETKAPDVVSRVVDEAYRGYYTDRAVLQLIERKTGVPATPPQPRGRTVRPADWSALKQRAVATAPLPPLLDLLKDNT